jgi:hypothetical protein
LEVWREIRSTPDDAPSLVDHHRAYPARETHGPAGLFGRYRDEELILHPARNLWRDEHVFFWFFATHSNTPTTPRLWNSRYKKVVVVKSRLKTQNILDVTVWIYRKKRFGLMQDVLPPS